MYIALRDKLFDNLFPFKKTSLLLPLGFKKNVQKTPISLV